MPQSIVDEADYNDDYNRAKKRKSSSAVTVLFVMVRTGTAYGHLFVSEKAPAVTDWLFLESTFFTVSQSAQENALYASCVSDVKRS